MKKLVWLTTSFVLFIVLVLPGILALGIKLIPANEQPGYGVEYKRGLYAASKVYQGFTSQENNLSGIGISIGNPNLKNKKDVILILYDDRENEIRKSVLSGLNISDGALVKFIFDAIPDSKDKKYLFSIQTPEANEVEILNIFHTDKKFSWMENVIFDTDRLEGRALPFITYHKPQSKLTAVKNIYTGWIKRVLGKI